MGRWSVNATGVVAAQGLERALSVDPQLFAAIGLGSAVLALACVVAILALVRALQGDAREPERRTGAAQLDLERERRERSEAEARMLRAQLVAAQETVVQAAEGDQRLADLSAELARVPGDTPRERALGMLRLRSGAGGEAGRGPSGQASEDEAKG